MKPKYLTLLALSAVMVLLQGCTHVAAYQRGALSKPEMAWNPDHQDATLQKHIYFAKEASSGGAEAAGGGCGCN
jgi:hypothetical protein